LISAAALALITGLLCLVLRLNVYGALAGWAGVSVAVSIYSARNIAKYAHDFATPQERLQVFREQVKFGFRVSFNQLLAHLNFQIDIFIVLFLLGHASLGMYSIAVGIGQMMWQLSRPLAVTSYGPVTSGNPQQAARVTMLCVRHALINVGVAAIILAAAGPLLIRIVYGPAFAPSGLALELLLPGILAYCTVPFFSQYFSLQLGKPSINTLVLASSTIICGVFTFFVAPHWGIIAGAVGTSISYVAALGIAASIFCRQTGVPFFELFAFSKHDMDQYRTLARWVFSGAQAP
jgi:O-antigen/teichoic acid export membrane protein